jgi:type IV pilus assembly protein PilQ
MSVYVKRFWVLIGFCLQISLALANEIPSKNKDAVNRFLPQQLLKSVDFRRGLKGEGLILLGLSAQNTVVDSQQANGGITLNLLNTKLPESLINNFEVSDFATPVKSFIATQQGQNVSINIALNTENYEYSSDQTNQLLTIAFRPINAAEKELQQRDNKVYRGNKLSLNFQDIEVRSVLQILADFTELNIVAADSVAGNVTLRLNDVPWDQALDLILKAKGLAKRQSGNVIMVAPVAEIMKIEQEELDAKKVFEELEPLKTENIQIHYAKAVEICNVLMGLGNLSQGGQSGAGGPVSSPTVLSGGCGSSSSMTSQNGQSNIATRLLSPRGAAIIDARTNTLIIKDTRQALDEARNMIKLLDVPVQQVLIEARIVVANTSFARELGMKFGANTKATGYKQTDGLAELGYTLQAASAVATGGMSTLGMTLASGANYLLDLEIQAMQGDGLGEQMANPRVMTTDRVKASITQGVQIPYTTQTANIINTNFKDAVLQLDVTPQITPGGSVIMELDITRDSQGKNVVTGGQENVAIDKRGIKTKVQVEDGETVVLGGVYESNYMDNKNSVPWFGDLPVLGWLFRDNFKRDDKTELLVFVTPKIVKSVVSASNGS